MSSNYPKVLLIGQSFNLCSGGGITMTNLFKGWDKERIAVASERIDIVDLSVCVKYYQLGYNESKRRFPFNLIEKKYPSGEMELGTLERKNKINNITTNKEKYPKLVRRYDSFSHFIGLYHYIRQEKVTDSFLRWVNNFAPDIIYTQLPSLATMKFVAELKKIINKPVAIHIMDDWPVTISKPGILQRYWRNKINVEFRNVLDLSNLFLSISDAMSEEYTRRYKKDFLAFHNPIEIEKWQSLKRKAFDKKNVILLYTGRIGLGIEHSLYEFAEAIQQINNQKNIHISLIIQTQKAPKWIADYDFVIQRFLDDYTMYPQSLAEADILILPYDFTKRAIDFIRYSFPTKASEYMISGTPILVYASKETAVCKHAIENEWAHVVTKNTTECLTNAILELIENDDIRTKIAIKAQDYATEHFDAEKVRERFLSSLNSTLNK